ncbi:MAG: leucine-rich repeat domain-containing protein [Alphaproteobacteria bacterium]|nr:leucine-rich repeat domain-containing protein [Alphaproteobacteria bacterium]
MKELLFILAAIFLPFSSNAWEACGTDDNGNTANCEYQIVNGTLTIRGVGNNGSIGNWDQDSGTIAPWRGKGVTNVVIEDSIKDLGSMGFRGITSVNPIEIPSSITTISGDAFFGVNSSEIIIPDSVTKIKSSAFSWSGLQKINIPDSVTSIEGGFRGTNLKDIVIPDSVTSIGNGAFSYCLQLQSITIGENTQLGKIFTGFNSDTGFTDIANLKIYCTGDTEKCDANLVAAGYPDLKSSKATTKQINGVTYVYDKNGKLVTSSGHRTEKRIYTIEEANEVAGTKNRVSITYR